MTQKKAKPDNQEKVPDLDSNIILKSSEYFRIAKAAEILSCKPEDLLHMGAIGSAEIMAAVVAEGVFEWPIGSQGIPFPEIDEPFREYFGVYDRVVLSKRDLARIEAVGWTIPSFFRDISRARELIERSEFFDTETLGAITSPADADADVGVEVEVELDGQSTSVLNADREATDNDAAIRKEYAAKFADLVERLSQSSEGGGANEEANFLREIAFQSPWQAVDPSGPNADKTTVDHLFITRKELVRLMNGLPQDPATLARNKITTEPLPRIEHGNTAGNAKINETILKAAIYCKEKWADKCGDTNTKWAEVIDAKADLFWPDRGMPPRSVDRIERLLGEARRFGDDVRKK